MILAILQARMASPRMPGKALASLAGEPMIQRQIERLRAARTLSRIVVATSVEAVDDPLAAFLVSRGQTVYRGAPVDLLGRFARCAESIGGVSHVVRIKGDAPFVDPALVDKAVRIAMDSGCDYVANRGWFGYPKGMEVEVVRAPLLIAAAEADRDPTRPHLADRLPARRSGTLSVGQFRRAARSVDPRLAGKDPCRPDLRARGLRRPAQRRPGLRHARRARPDRRAAGLGEVRGLGRKVADDRYLEPGCRVRLINHADGSSEDGIVVHCWWAEEIAAYDCYVAFLGQSIPEGRPHTKPYVLRYASISLSDI